MPTLLQKIRLAIRGWNRRREEAEKQFLAKNTWSGGQTILSVPSSEGQIGLSVLHIDREGLGVAFLDDSGVIAYYLDTESGDVVDVRDGAQLAPPRYRRIPTRSEQSEAEDRRAFVASLDPSRARDALAGALGSREEFRRAVAADRAIERAWFSFKNDRAIAAIEQWLEKVLSSRA